MAMGDLGKLSADSLYTVGGGAAAKATVLVGPANNRNTADHFYQSTPDQ